MLFLLDILPDKLIHAIAISHSANTSQSPSVQIAARGGHLAPWIHPVDVEKSATSIPTIWIVDKIKSWFYSANNPVPKLGEFLVGAPLNAACETQRPGVSRAFVVLGRPTSQPQLRARAHILGLSEPSDLGMSPEMLLLRCMAGHHDAVKMRSQTLEKLSGRRSLAKPRRPATPVVPGRRSRPCEHSLRTQSALLECAG